jgi:SAM-dependent methyltransferase
MDRVKPPRACSNGSPQLRPLLRWPLPALAAWAAAWALYLALAPLGRPAAGFAGVAAGLAIASSWPAGSMRRRIVGAGFPLSLIAAALAASLPAALWLLPLAALALVYPLAAWRDAPWYPTPAGALDGLGRATGLPIQARVLDAGCGLGDGLRALRRALPGARLAGVERSRLLGWIAARRCRDADVRCGDMWAVDWGRFELVYLFQRPESMARAWAKACAELPPGGWLASLEFEVPGRDPDAGVSNVAGKPVWLYRAERTAQPEAPDADNSAGRPAGIARAPHLP